MNFLLQKRKISSKWNAEAYDDVTIIYYSLCSNMIESRENENYFYHIENKKIQIYNQIILFLGKYRAKSYR